MNHLSNSDLWVVIPTYNRADDLISCLESLLKAGIPEDYIIIVDNNSQDDTIKKLKKTFTAAVLFALEKNKGATGASNIGFQYALSQGAKYILRLDSDTIVDQEFLSPLINKIIEDPQIGVVAPKVYYFEPPDEIWYAGADAHPWHFGTVNGHRHEKDAPENSHEREVDYTWGAAMLIKNEVLEQTGGFDTDFFVYYEEVDFCLRVKNLGYKIVFVPQSHVWHKVGSLAQNDWTAYHWNRSKMLLYRKHARNAFHLSFLICYAFLYAFWSAIFDRKKFGNRGPLKSVLLGLFHGIMEKFAEE